MIIQNTRTGGETDLTFTVTKDDFDRSLEISEAVAKEVGAEEVLTAKDIAKVSVIGLGMKSHSGVAATMFKALAEENINIRLISTSEIRIPASFWPNTRSWPSGPCTPPSDWTKKTRPAIRFSRLNRFHRSLSEPPQPGHPHPGWDGRSPAGHCLEQWPVPGW